MQICPVNHEWVHNYIVEPYLKGCQLMNSAWHGEHRSLVSTPLSLKERVICWLQGTCLLIPFINTIIWLAWQAFGTPEMTFDPYCPEIEPTPPPAIVDNDIQAPAPPPLVRPILIPEDQVKPTELFGYTEKVGNSNLEVDWKIEHFRDVIIAQQDCQLYSSTSLYRPDLSLSEYHYTMGPKKCDIWQNDDDRNHVHLKFVDEGIAPIERTFEIPEPLPIIQQRAIGLRRFVQSNENELSFFALIPEIPGIRYIPFLAKPPFLMKTHAKKIGEEDVPGHGRLLKVEVMSAWGFPYNTIKSEMWFDVATGLLRKFVDTGAFITRKEGEIRNIPQRA